ncbi:hypothetical protein [Sulfurimicrobium lacus]|uniref:hypothetical protein n=1 Tax=Sulfurimicrobium lacus TaxID=2715678 RepID=UPI001FCE377A|nr:hypothetical protein [Sulfurimicrobium lacus]
MLLYPMASSAQVSIGIGFPNVSIGINLPVYPQLVRIPGYPVYYAPRLGTNFFFYDTMYWVFQDDNWYASSWYNGPWGLVEPEYVPLFVLRIPVRYYRQPPPYFRGWRSDAPPRWGDHWGHEWEHRRSGWDRWNRNAAPAPAPLPAYQRQYSGDRYPHQVEQQQSLQQRNYRYQPRDPVVRQHYQEQAGQRTPAERGSRQQDTQRVAPRQQAAPAPAPREQSPQLGRPEVQRQERTMQSAPPQQERRGAPEERGSRRQDLPAAAPRAQPPQPEASPREQQRPNPQGREDRQPGRDSAREPQRGQERERERGRDRND